MTLVSAALALCLADGNSTLHVRVTGAEPRRGQVIASLFASPEAYLQAPLEQAIGTVDASGTVVLRLGEHRPVEYAVVVIHDRNENGALDTGLFGIPRDKVRLSNNAKGCFGPAGWDDARFILNDADPQIEIQLTPAK